MDWKSHALIGIILTFFVLYLALGMRDAAQLAYFSAFGALCALAPDLDDESSKGKKIADIAAIALAIWIPYTSECKGTICLPTQTLTNIAFTALAVLGAYFVIFTLFKPRHRGITHTLAVCFGFVVLIYVLAGFVAAIAAGVGYLSHLIADRELKVL